MTDHTVPIRRLSPPWRQLTRICRLLANLTAILAHQPTGHRPDPPVLATARAHRGSPPVHQRRPRCRGPPAPSRLTAGAARRRPRPTTTDQANTDPKEGLHHTRLAAPADRQPPAPAETRHAEKARVIVNPMSSTYSYQCTQVGKFD